ncbi:MAG TPA: cell surface protein SprA [Porphyromonadaceae bacterium]|nr:cell surface protein SprA [Porphyromonadaceae bacterium]
MERLYNKSPYLSKVNKRFNSTQAMNTFSSSSSSTLNSPTKRPKTRNKFSRSIYLSKEGYTLINHNLDTKSISVKAYRIVGKDSIRYPIKYKIKGENTIEIRNKDSLQILLSISASPKRGDTRYDGEGINTWDNILQYSAQFLMMIKSIGITYKTTNSSSIPYFKPNVGDIFGQRSDGILSPGLDFAFGLTDETYLDKALERDWLILNDTMVNPASFNKLQELQITLSLEPIRALKIDLNANRIFNDNRQIQFMFPNKAPVYGGNFSITTIALSTHFEGCSASNGYSSSAFNKMLEYRDVIAQRLQSAYSNTSYPNNGFLTNSQWAGQRYNPSNGTIDKNSSDVLIPAFIAAYTGQSASNVSLSPFIALKRLLPNWKITYSGLLGIPFFRTNFKRFELSHAYRCVYSVGPFTSYQNWATLHSEDLGFTPDVTNGNPIPSSPYSVSSVAITETFAPLLGINATWKNNISFKLEYKDARTVSLNISSLQVVDSKKKELVIGAGYKITNFKTFFNRFQKRGKNSFSTDLTLQADFSYARQNAFIRRILTGLSEATSGAEAYALKLIASYALSSSITLNAFYDRQVTIPLVSSNAYPITNSDFGVSMKFSLNHK